MYSEFFWKKKEVRLVQKYNIRSCWEQLKRPGTGSLIQDVTDSGLKSHIVNNLIRLWETEPEQIHMHFSSQLLCFSFT